MTDAWRLDTLPADVLILIFDYCHAFDLVRLSEVCTRFYDIVRGDTLWIKKSKQPLVTNQTSPKFRDRCNTLLNLRKRWHVSHNWQYGRYARRVYALPKTKVMPWIQLTNDRIWWSGGNRLCGFRRNLSCMRRDCVFYEENISSDVCKFIVRDKCIISGHRDGSLQFWSKVPSGTNHLSFSIEKAHSCDVNAVDETSQAIVSGSGDGTVKIWSGNAVAAGPTATIDIGDRVWSLAIDPEGLKFAVGSSGNAAGPPLHLFDLECYSQSDVLAYNWRRGAGLLDMVWDNPHTLLTCGYDTYIRKWDLRTGKCVGAWPDPTDASLYCIATDYHYTMLTGTQFNCKAVLWDQRQKNYVQLYFMHRRRVSSPVYSIGFDSSELYGATDQHLANLTFSGYSYQETNYRNF